MKWLLLGIGGLVLFQIYRNSQTTTTSSGGGGLVSGSGGSVTSFVSGLTGLTNAVSKLFHGENTTVSDPDGLMKPNF